MPPVPLRIALLVKALPLHRPGGQENHAWALARGLADAGHRVTVVTTAHPEGEAECRIDGVRVLHLSGTLPGRNSWRFFRRVAQWTRLFEGEFDIIHAQGFAALRVPTLATPLVTTVHGTVWSETPLARQVRPLLSPGERLAALWRFRGRTVLGATAHRAWARSARLICDSVFTRDELLRLRADWEARVDVVPLGMTLPPAAPPRDEPTATRPLRLLSVGRVERVRGHSDLLRAIAGLAEPGRVHLTIVGDGRHLPALRREAARLGVEAQVTFAGRVDDETLRDRWREADLFVNPEWSQPAFGLVTLEALGWGLPVLGTQSGATPEIVTPSVGWLVAPGQPAALGAALEALIAQPEKIEPMRAAARRRAEEFSVEAMIEGTLATYERAQRGW